MKATVAILTRWRREDPDRLLEAALRQARELAELLPELDGLRNQNVVLGQQLEIQAKRIAQLEEALQAAERAAHRQAAPFRIEEKKRVSAPKRPGRKPGHPGAFRHKPDQIDEDIEVHSRASRKNIVVDIKPRFIRVLFVRRPQPSAVELNGQFTSAPRPDIRR
jgi:transposase